MGSIRGSILYLRGLAKLISYRCHHIQKKKVAGLKDPLYGIEELVLKLC